MFSKYIFFIGISFLCCVLRSDQFSSGPGVSGIKKRWPNKGLSSQAYVSRPLSIAEQYLNQYGYLQTVRRHRRQNRRQAIRRFQENAGLKETGKLNRRTIKKMMEPRCGYPDTEEKQTRRKRQAVDKIYWPQATITWSPTKYSRKLSTLQQWRTFKQALQTWARVIPRRFLYVKGNADLSISFERWEHGDGYYNAFDGRGMKLAHAFEPGEHSISGDTHFDADENWHLNQFITRDNSPNLLAVATHEFGHAIGLKHSSNSKDVMSPYFTAVRTKLSEWDIKAVQKLYGHKMKTTETNPQNDVITTTAAPTKPVKIMKKLPECSGFDAIFIDKNKNLNIISNSTLFKIRRRVPVSGYPVRVQTEFPGAPESIAAVAHIRNKVYIFKGSHVWRYTYDRLDYGFPKYIKTHEVGEEPRAAIVTEGMRNKRVFLFGVEESGVMNWNNSDMNLRDSIRSQCYSAFCDCMVIDTYHHAWRLDTNLNQPTVEPSVVSWSSALTTTLEDWIQRPACLLWFHSYRHRLFLSSRRWNMNLGQLEKSKFWEWSVHNDDVYRRMQYSTSRYWRNVPSSPDAAIMWKDRYIYFIKGNLYYKVNRRYRRVMRGYPKRMPPPWLDGIC